MKLSEAEKKALTARAIEELKLFDRPIVLTLDIKMMLMMIGQLQLAFRHPGNVGLSRQEIEAIVRNLIEEIDPSRGDIYKLLMLGFDPKHDA